VSRWCGGVVSGGRARQRGVAWLCRASVGEGGVAGLAVRGGGGGVETRLSGSRLEGCSGCFARQQGWEGEVVALRQLFVGDVMWQSARIHWSAACSVCTNSNPYNSKYDPIVWSLQGGCLPCRHIPCGVVGVWCVEQKNPTAGRCGVCRQRQATVSHPCRLLAALVACRWAEVCCAPRYGHAAWQKQLLRSRVGSCRQLLALLQPAPHCAGSAWQASSSCV
jgi:hypothetical protein